MDYFNIAQIKDIVITFENLEQITISNNYIDAIGVEKSRWPNINVFNTVPYITNILFNQTVYNSPDIYQRLRQNRDITWVDVIFKNKKHCEWVVPWEDDPDSKDENALQKNNEFEQGFRINIGDYIEMLE